ncbi:MAG: hypothetical protein ABR906_04415 [Terracidiphilus sp.]
MRQAENKKPPAAFAGGGLGAALPLNLFCQAPFPAHALNLVIRMARIGIGMRRPRIKLVLAPEVCMTLIAVEQTSKVRVKKAGSRAIA